MNSQSSKEYAMALFDLAKEAGGNQAASYLDALELIGSTLSENPEYTLFLACPTILKSERIAAVGDAFGDSLPEYILSFFQLLVEKNQVHLIGECIADYRALYEADAGILPAAVTSARALTDGEKSKLCAALEKKFGKSVRLICECDPALIGGMVVEIDGVKIDGSLRHRLNEVKEVMRQ